MRPVRNSPPSGLDAVAHRHVDSRAASPGSTWVREHGDRARSLGRVRDFARRSRSVLEAS
jgi:hypothetical protein